jgi:hypothetical protein
MMFGLLALLALAPPGWAGDKARAAPQTPGEQYKALVKEYEGEQEAFSKAYQEARTDADKQKVYEEKYPKNEKYTPRFLELARKHPKGDVGFDSLLWVIRHNFGSPKGKQGPLTEALALVREHHLKSERLTKLLPLLAFAEAKAGEALLRKALKKNPHREVKGLACLTLARLLHRRSQTVLRLKERPEMRKALAKRLGNKQLRNLLAADPDDLAWESEYQLERVAARFADVKYRRHSTLGKVARSELFEIRNLVIGKTAPEIEGEDQDGKRFKLSDYRGKVVVLDFWGNW